MVTMVRGAVVMLVAAILYKHHCYYQGCVLFILLFGCYDRVITRDICFFIIIYSVLSICLFACLRAAKKR